MKKLVYLLLAVCLLVCSGCSVETDASADASAEVSVEASSDSDVIQVNVGTSNVFAPYCYLDEDGNSIGYDVDVLAAVDEYLEDYEFNLVAADWSTLLVSIDSGSIDMVSYQIVKSAERKEKYLFPEQYYSLSPLSLAVQVDSGINSMADMAGKSIDISPATYEFTVLNAYNKDHPGEELEINPVNDQTTADGYKKISNGLVDGILTYEATFNKVIDEIGITNLELTDVVLVEDSYMMFANDEQEFCDAVDGALKALLEDGTLSEISNKWFEEDIFTVYKDLIQVVAE